VARDRLLWRGHSDPFQPQSSHSDDGRSCRPALRHTFDPSLPVFGSIPPAPVPGPAALDCALHPRLDLVLPGMRCVMDIEPALVLGLIDVPPLLSFVVARLRFRQELISVLAQPTDVDRALAADWP